LKLWDFFQPLIYVMKPCVIIPAVAYAAADIEGFRSEEEVEDKLDCVDLFEANG
jgi:hypothetical protein